MCMGKDQIFKRAKETFTFQKKSSIKKRKFRSKF